MDNIELVHILHAAQDLLEEARALPLLDARVAHDVVEELAAAGELHD